MKYKVLSSIAIAITVFLSSVAYASENNNTIKAIIASYDENGRLCDVRATDLNLPDSRNNITIVSLNRNEDTTKMYIWNDLKIIRPLTNSVQTQKGQK